MDERVYCGNGKSIPTQYGDLLKLSLTEDDVKTLQENLDNGWVNVTVKQRREPSQSGFTHYLEIDNWKPDPSKAKPAEDSKAATSTEEINPEDLPF
jgi:hypothetical protein